MGPTHPIARVLPLLEPAHLDRDFDYLVPPDMDALAQPGVRVRIRFSGRLIDGYLLERLERTDHTGRLMPLDRVVSGERVLTPEILRLITAVAARYAGTRADVLRLAVPPRHARTEAEDPVKPPKKRGKASASPAGSTDDATVADGPAVIENADTTAPGDSAESEARTTAAPSSVSVASGVGDAATGAPNSSATEPVPPTDAAPESPGGAAATGRHAGTEGAAALEVPDPLAAETIPPTPEVVGPQADSDSTAITRGGDPLGPRAVVAETGPPSHVHGAVETGASEARDRVRPETAELTVEVPAPRNRIRPGATEVSGTAGRPVDPTDGGEAKSGAAGVRLVNALGLESVRSDDGAVGPGGLVGVTSEAEREHSGSAVAHEAAGAGSGGDAGDSDDPVGDPVDVRAAESSDVAAVDISSSAWRRYRHGESFLAALGQGKGPRAAWQALPGEDWAARLAELAAVVVAAGRSAIIMVPDQRDLDRVLAACVDLTGEAAVGLAAGLGPAARYRRWLAILRGSARIVVGTRSAIFAPARDLGLIAIWDDGDDTYAEPRSPYPHAREVAMLRVHESGAAFVAGGFARTAEIHAVVEAGWAHDLVADRAVLRECAPRISAPGDTDVALERDPMARAARIPGEAFMVARKALAAGMPVLVQVPRRGYVPALACSKCRTPARCRHCNGPLALPDGNGEPPAASHPVGSRAQRRGAAAAAALGESARAEPDPARSHPGSARELGITLSRSSSNAVAHSPSCRWCGIVEAAFRCSTCGSRVLRGTVIGAARTAEELGRAFPGVPIRGSGGAEILDTVPAGPQVVVATIGAEPSAPGGYGVALLLDGWALLGRADLRAAEDALRRWMSAATLVRHSGRVLVMAEPSLPTVQALVRWDPVGHADLELNARTEVRFPPAVRLAVVDGTTDSVAELLGEAKLPADVELLGPVPLPPGARKPFSSGDSPAEVERMILRVDRNAGAALSRALTAAQAVRSTHRDTAPLRVQIDPVDIG
ncbi:hypothetical protein LBW94_002610 [Nocardia sp. alder85J]|nr:primosomal protein N' [Nocardia sp. alder85J]MCX4091228.1 hypothetical protein [Nocardia sp. alder85J]